MLRQTSIESPAIFDMFKHMFKNVNLEELKSKSKLSKDEFEDFLQYVVQFYGNLGNYLSFGDTKFIVSDFLVD